LFLYKLKTISKDYIHEIHVTEYIVYDLNLQIPEHVPIVGVDVD